MNHRATCLAACDDAGDVRVLDLKTHKWMRKFERTHDNVRSCVFMSDNICNLCARRLLQTMLLMNHMAFISFSLSSYPLC